MSKLGQMITDNTGVALGLVITLLMATATAGWWAAGTLNDMKRDLREQSQKMAEVWTKADQELWSLKLQLRNPALRIPGQEDIKTANNSKSGSNEN